MKKKIFKIILSAFLVVALIGIIGTCYFTGISVFNSSMQLVTNEDTSSDYSDYLEENGIDLEEFNEMYNVEKIEIQSTLDNHKIPADYMLANNEKNNDTVVLVHGLGGNRLSVYPVAKLFLENGYNVIAYDQRSSGENTAKYTTCGYLESKDLLDYVSYINNIIDKDKNIIVWGTSFGGATVGTALGDSKADEYIDYAILDCPVSNFEYMIKEEMKEMNIGIPISFMLCMGNITTKLKLGFSYDDMNVCNYIKDTKVPVLIINSKADEVTPYFMGEDLYNAINSENKKLFTVEDSEHANIFFDYYDKYKEEVLEFIK